MDLELNYNINLDILCFTETFVKRGTESNILFRTYKLAHYFSREREKRGGSCILVKTELDFKPIDITKILSSTYDFECCGIELTRLKIIIVCIYRTPSSNIYNFFRNLHTLLLNLTKKKKKVVICGDWNIDVLKDNKYSKELKTILKNYNLFNHINQPTRQKSCLDQIASNISNAIRSHIHHLGLSDHETAQIIEINDITKNKSKNSEHWYEYKRDFSKENRKKFVDCISSLTFSEIYNFTDCNKAFDSFHDIISLFHNLCFPYIKIKMTEIKTKQNWFTKGLKKSSVCKRRLYIKFKFCKTNKNINKNNYKKYDRIFKKCVSKAQQIYNTKYIQNSNNKCRATWTTIKEKTNARRAHNNVTAIHYNNDRLTDPNKIVNIFNDYFIDLTTNISQTTSSDTKHIKTNPKTIFLTPTSPLEILKIVMSLKNSKSVGYDGIDTNTIKSCAKYICEPLSHIINLSFEEGHFPEKLKYSIVKPLHKKGDTCDLNNYRPITLIPIFSKIIEKAMNVRMLNFFCEHNILQKEQFGFRKNSSTTLATFNLVKVISESLNYKTPVTTIFLDMSKAYDLVVHDTLLEKLDKYGVRGNAYNWVKSYLENRHQRTEISKVETCHKQSTKIVYKSPFRKNRSRAIPQGSIIGPLLFLTYINDLPRSTTSECILFADDTTLIIKDKNRLMLKNKIIDSLNEITTWLKNNNLALNVTKTKIINFNTNRTITDNIDIIYNGKQIDEVDHTKFLGIIIDKNLTWKFHIDHICSKLDRFIFALRRIRYTVSEQAAWCAYHGYVSSVLNYGLIIWGNSSYAIQAFRVQKKCIRTICNAHWMDSCRPLFKKYKILPLPSLYIRDICLLVHRYPEYFKKVSEYSTRTTRYPNKLLVPNCALQIYKKNVYFMAIKIYNKLPDSLKQLPYNQFKKILTSWILDKCFYCISDYLELRNIDIKI